MSDVVVEQPLPSLLAAKNPVLVKEGMYEGLPLHFGWPADEQDALERGEGFAYLGVIGIVQVSGPDRLSWLTTLSSQVLTDLVPGRSKEVLLLDPQGRVTFQMGALDDGERTWLITEPACADGLEQFLRSMQFMLRVEVNDVSRRYRATFTSTQADDAARRDTQWVRGHDGVVWEDPWPGVEEGGARYFLGDHPAQDSKFRLYVVPAAAMEEFIAFSMGDEGGGKQPVGLLAAEATRVAAWRPMRGNEVDDRTLPAEVDWLRSAVHLSKGCYCGQESVARIINLGKPPRRLVFLQLDGSAEILPALGAPVEFNGRQVGVLTSVARHWEMGPIGLALVKRNLDPEAVLKIQGVDAAQEAIVSVEGKSDHSPEQRPGAGLSRLDAGKRDIRTRGPGAGK